MARELGQILQELNSVYAPQKDAYNAQIKGLDPQMQADQAGLDAAKTDSFNQITTGANRRGLLFSGIPLAEQAQYTGATYLPSVANLKSKYAQQRFNLQDALAGVTKDQYLKGQDIYQTELNRDQSARDAAASRAASASSGFSPTFGGGVGGAGNTGVLGASNFGNAVKKQGGGFAFTAPNGQSLSAAQYAQAAGVPFRGLLSWMAGQGDNGAKQALQFVGNDFGYNPNAINNNGDLYNSLVWGTGRQFSGARVNAPGLSQAGVGGNNLAPGLIKAGR